MRIPASAAERLEFVTEVLDICQGSREERQSAYRTLKQYYLYGQESGTSVDQNVFGVVNKIFPHIDKTCSMLYSPDTTRFAVEIGRNVDRAELKKVDPLTDAVQDRWHNAELDTKYGEALRWAHVYGSMFVKTRPQNQDLTADIVEPHHVGVYREDLMGLANQEAFYHEYRIPKAQLVRILEVSGIRDPGRIVAEAVENMGDSEEQVTQPIDRIVTSSALPNAQGEINTYIGSRVSYIPKLKQPMVRMYELYVYDDELEDYRVFTCAHPFLPIFDRSIDTMFLKDELPLIQVCPFPMYGYFWGMSPVERLLNLQMIRNTRWDQVQHLMELQANPPKVATGDFMASIEEIQAAMDSPGGMASASSAGSDLKAVEPSMPDDLFAEVNYIDGQFDDAIGTTEIMQGKGEAGVRSEGHATQLMRAGSSRLKARALIIERQLEELATLILKIMQKYSDRTYTVETGDPKNPLLEFTAEQFTDDFIVRVDAHSSSPVFMQDMSNIAFALFKAKAITRAKLIDMLNVPMKDLLKMELETKIEPAEAKAAAQARQLELVTGKAPKAAAGGKK
jgi:hypothetical protein